MRSFQNWANSRRSVSVSPRKEKSQSSALPCSIHDPSPPPPSSLWWCSIPSTSQSMWLSWSTGTCPQLSPCRCRSTCGAGTHSSEVTAPPSHPHPVWASILAGGGGAGCGGAGSGGGSAVCGSAGGGGGGHGRWARCGVGGGCGVLRGCGIEARDAAEGRRGGRRWGFWGSSREWTLRLWARRSSDRE
jgi:hypothetical protein